MKWGYPIIITKNDNDTYRIVYPLFSNVTTVTKNEETALNDAVNTITSMFEMMLLNGEHIPSPVEYKDKIAHVKWIQLPEDITLKAYLHNLELTAQRSK